MLTGAPMALVKDTKKKIVLKKHFSYFINIDCISSNVSLLYKVSLTDASTI
jgi:hypothetical protein